MIVAYLRLTDRGTTSWDEELETRVEHRRIGAVRMIVVAAIVIAVIVLKLVSSFSSRLGP